MMDTRSSEGINTIAADGNHGINSSSASTSNGGSHDHHDNKHHPIIIDEYKRIQTLCRQQVKQLERQKSVQQQMIHQQQSGSSNNEVNSKFWNETLINFNHWSSMKVDDHTNVDNQKEDERIISYPNQLFGLQGFQGFFVLKSFLSHEQIMTLANHCLKRYCESPHRTNLDVLNHMKKDGCTSSSASEIGTTNTTTTTHDTNQSSSNHSQSNKHKKECSLWEEWKEIHRDEIMNFYNQNQHHTESKIGETKKYNKGQTTRKSRLDQISWSTLGYHYNWTERSYTDDEQSFIPIEFHHLATDILQHVETNVRERSYSNYCAERRSESEKKQDEGKCHNNLDENNNDSSHDTNEQQHTFNDDDHLNDDDDEMGLQGYTKFISQACIVNYYHTKSVMGGHLDDLEYTFDQPVISISLGCSGIFLLGQTCDRQKGPVVTILVEHGDVIIMGGSSRLRYHGMACMIPYTFCSTTTASSTYKAKNNKHQGCPYDDEEDNGEDADNAAMLYYLSTHRININLRQVLPNNISTIAQYHKATAKPEHSLFQKL